MNNKYQMQLENFSDVNNRLDKVGLMMHGGTIVDASLIAASKSTENQDGKRILKSDKEGQWRVLWNEGT